MNILIPDSWLRQHLRTDATPKQLKDYLSLCGPSIERIHTSGDETVYDIEITTNRPDSMSVLGIAREAAAILPRFGVGATLVGDLYTVEAKHVAQQLKKEGAKKLNIDSDATLNPRFTAVVIDGIAVKKSPPWLQKKFALAGIRALNSIVDITNYLMRAYGQPVHAFDYSEVKPDKTGIPTMIVRASKKGERVITLDHKEHTLPGDDIVIEDGAGRLIDLCGIMGALNSSVTASTTSIVLFMQTYDPMHIRRTSMNLAHRTEAASLFEKGIDSELALPTMLAGIELVCRLTGGTVGSRLYDVYHTPYKKKKVSVSRDMLSAYLGTTLPDKEITKILTSLGLIPELTQSDISVFVPSFRRDIDIGVDIIEEIARLYGYHNIKTKLPDREPPMPEPAKNLSHEEDLKLRLRDWGYIETYTYSMISESLMSQFHIDTTEAYKLANPLSDEWAYMRPTLIPSALTVASQNLGTREEFMTFELSMVYRMKKGDLPDEEPMLVLLATGDRFGEAKGVADAVIRTFGISYEELVKPVDLDSVYLDPAARIGLGAYGSVGLVKQSYLSALHIHKPITIVSLSVRRIMGDMRPNREYRGIPKYPASYEDIALTVPSKTLVGPMIDAFKKAHPFVRDVTLLDRYETTRTFHIVYQHPEKNLTNEEIRSAREQILTVADVSYGARLKT